LPQELAQSALDLRDRSFVTELVYGTLRMQGRHDWVLSQVSDRPWSEVDDDVVDLSRLGVHQLHEMRTPAHAAVSATIEVARKILGESKASFVNALLRKVSALTLEEWLAKIPHTSDEVSRLAITHSHPEWIVSAYCDLLGDISEVTTPLEANNAPASPTLVSWPGRSTQQDLISAGGVATKFSRFGAHYQGNPGELELVRKRLAGVQDEGSQIVAEIFATVAKDSGSWLDICAGPGGKAALLSSLAESFKRSFSANEISEPRANLVRQVVVYGDVLTGDGRSIANIGKSFDAILADVPCTGLGALRRRPEVRWRRTAEDLSGLASLQRELLDASLSVLQPGGYLAYVTCSPHLAETRVVIKDALKRNPTLEVVNLDPYLPAGLTEATNSIGLQLWPHRHNTDAMFMSVLRKPVG
jgi:16S rRNA (cytosine967-C5)-methyltransferase